jgi:hypothetical protein
VGYLVTGVSWGDVSCVDAFDKYFSACPALARGLMWRDYIVRSSGTVWNQSAGVLLVVKGLLL